MEREIIKTIRYFHLFDYLPNFEEIYIFLPYKTTKSGLKKYLSHLERQNKITTIYSYWRNDYLYTIGEYSTKLKVKNLKLKIRTLEKRWEESKRKLKTWRFRLYLKLLSLIPFIKLVGLSGSISMMNAKKEDDIDLFIISEENRLFTSRFLAIILGEILRLRRKPWYRIIVSSRLNPIRSGSFPNAKFYKKIASTFFKDKVCLNLFFEATDLEIPDFKKTEYVAHEVLQMKPIINKDYFYEKFLIANQWVKEFYPNSLKNLKLKIKNSKLKIKIKKHRLVRLILDQIENMLKKFQLYLINKHKTKEIITDSQLWFHPEDFGKRFIGR